jgi:hypothetical protein
MQQKILSVRFGRLAPIVCSGTLLLSNAVHRRAPRTPM